MYFWMVSRCSGLFFFIKKLMEKLSLQNGSFFHPFLLRLLVPLFKVSSRTIYNSNKKENFFKLKICVIYDFVFHKFSLRYLYITQIHHLKIYIYIAKNRGDFTNKGISLSCKILHVAAQGWQGGVATSVMINVRKVLLMPSYVIKSVFVHTHTQLLGKWHGLAWSIMNQKMFFTHFSLLSPPKTHIDTKTTQTKF